MKLLALALLPFTALAFQPDVVLDDADSNAVELVGPWTAETSLTYAYRGSSKVITSATANAGQYARFHTVLPVSGPWKVFVWHNGRGGFGNEVGVITKAAGGETSSAKMAQHVYAGQWMLLGTYWFDSTEEAEVKISHNITGPLSADAVRFSFADPEVVLDSTGDSLGVALYGASGISSAAWASVSPVLSGNEMSIRRSSTVGAHIDFAPSLPTPGDYEVSLWLPRRGGDWVTSGKTGVTSVQVEVTARSGTTTHTVDLPPDNGPNEGAWVQVGTVPFRFDATPAGQSGGPAKVCIKGPTNTTLCVPADAVRLTKIGTLGIYQDDDDPFGPPGVALGAKLYGQGSSWMTEGITDRLARRFLYYNYQPFGPRASKAGNNDQKATFTPPISQQGMFDVYLWYPWSSGNSPTTLVSVQARTTTTTNDLVTRTVNQSVEAGKWTHVGRYLLDPNLPGQPAKSWLTIEPDSNAADKFTKVDAVLFLKDGDDTDADGDGLVDTLEPLLGTDTINHDGNHDGVIRAWDTDGDGMSDGDEVRIGRNPLRVNAADGTEQAARIYTLAELTDPALLQLVIAQLRNPNPIACQDAVTALTSVNQPKIIGVLLSDFEDEAPERIVPADEPDDDPGTTEDVAEAAALEAEKEGVSPDVIPAPVAAAVVVLAQVRAQQATPADVSAWILSITASPPSDFLLLAKAFIAANRDALKNGEFAELTLAEPPAE